MSDTYYPTATAPRVVGENARQIAVNGPPSDEQASEHVPLVPVRVVEGGACINGERYPDDGQPDWKAEAERLRQERDEARALNQRSLLGIADRLQAEGERDRLRAEVERLNAECERLGNALADAKWDVSP